MASISLIDGGSAGAHTPITFMVVDADDQTTRVDAGGHPVHDDADRRICRDLGKFFD
jgi:hypothetical protein